MIVSPTGERVAMYQHDADRERDYQRTLNRRFGTSKEGLRQLVICRLHIVHGMSFCEIGDLLNLSGGEAEHRYARSGELPSMIEPIDNQADRLAGERAITQSFGITRHRRKQLMIWRLHTYHAMTFRQIGDVIVHAGGHACRIYHQALTGLRDHFGSYRDSAA